MKSQLSIVEKRAISSKKLQNRQNLNDLLNFNIIKSAKLYKLSINNNK